MSKLFDTIRAIKGAALTQADVDAVNAAMAEKSTARKLSDAGVALIRSFEGCVLKAYSDPATKADPWTIGVGHTGPEVKPGLVITEAQADAYLRKDVGRFEAAVNRLAPVTTQGQFDALVSFAFNLGEGNLASSTLLKKHNAADYDGAAAQFGLWNKANGAVMTGLTRRRAAEARVYKGLLA